MYFVREYRKLGYVGRKIMFVGCASILAPLRPNPDE